MLNDTESVVVTASNANLSYQRDIGQNVTGKLSEYPAVLDRTTRNSTVYDRLKDEDGAALYVIAIISLFATAIVLFIGMMSFKKKKYDEWDRQAVTYLATMYKRRLRDEKEGMRNQQPRKIGIIAILQGLSTYPLKSGTAMTPMATVSRDDDGISSAMDYIVMNHRGLAVTMPDTDDLTTEKDTNSLLLIPDCSPVTGPPSPNTASTSTFILPTDDLVNDSDALLACVKVSTL